MRVLYLDCFSGISGDMMVGALCDLGVKPSAMEWELSKIDIGDFHMHFERAQRQNIEGVQFGIHEGATHRHREAEREHEGEHHHEHGHGEEEHDHSAHEHHHGRTHGEIRALIAGSGLSDFVKKHASSIFQRIAVAEGKIHGGPPEEVQFHEVGALDSIADILCSCAGLEQLNVQKVFVSALYDGTGWIDCAHGRLPIPAPATLEILAGTPFRQIDEPFEFITPTGAAIAAEFGVSFGPMPHMTVEKVGYGIGSRDLPNRPNVLRAILGEMGETAPYETDTITRIETNIDDLSPEIVGAVLGKLLDAGALDAYLTPVQMKKGRPGIHLTVLCEDSLVAAVADLLFAETSSFGIRMDRVQRLKLERKSENVETPFGRVAVKLGLRDGRVVQVAPEFESCRALSEKSGQPLRIIYDAARSKFASPE